jgi:uncharacterized membrane protein YeaQ/YmgE (transglycosylase-associated protein family)
VVFVLFAIVVALFVVLPLIGIALWALLSTIVVGLAMGALGRLVVPGSQPIGLVATCLSGLAGSIVGGFIGQHLLDVGRLATILIEIGIAALVVAVYAGPAHRLERQTGP